MLSFSQEISSEERIRVSETARLAKPALFIVLHANEK